MAQIVANSYVGRLEESLPVVRERIERATEASGRAPRSVRLVAVTKGHPPEAVEAALSAGLRDLGENRVEELEGKVGAFGRESATWHLIGHLQSRKARRAMDLAHLIHSVDSLRLGERLSRMAVDTDRDRYAARQIAGGADESLFSHADDRKHEILD